MKKAIVQFNGGLGNQLFQAAYGLSLQANDYAVRYSTVQLRKQQQDTPRQYELSFLNLPLVKFDFITKRLYSRVGDSPLFTVHPLPKAARIYATGYWQHEHYASYLKPALLKALPISPQKGCLLAIRRGDYVTNPNATRFHGLCSKEHYQSALQWLPKNVPITVTTDDPQFVLGEFSDIFAKVKPIFLPTTTPVNDLKQMLGFEHYIIGNSSFHWWASYLSNPVTVYAPLQWTSNVQANTFSPKHWNYL